LADNPPCSLSRRRINRVHCPPKSSTTIPPCSAFSACLGRSSFRPVSCPFCSFSAFIPSPSIASPPVFPRGAALLPTSLFIPPQYSATYPAHTPPSQSFFPSGVPPLPHPTPPTSSLPQTMPPPPPSTSLSPSHSPAPQFRLPLPLPAPRCRPASPRSTIRRCAPAFPTTLPPDAA